LNEADHAKYVMLPNVVMVGSPSADLPAQGILHNVKGVARRKQRGMKNNFIQNFKDLIQDFKTK
jgi:hypothetical protein